MKGLATCYKCHQLKSCKDIPNPKYVKPKLRLGQYSQEPAKLWVCNTCK